MALTFKYTQLVLPQVVSYGIAPRPPSANIPILIWRADGIRLTGVINWITSILNYVGVSGTHQILVTGKDGVSYALYDPPGNVGNVWGSTMKVTFADPALSNYLSTLEGQKRWIAKLREYGIAGALLDLAETRFKIDSILTDEERDSVNTILKTMSTTLPAGVGVTTVLSTYYSSGNLLYPNMGTVVGVDEGVYVAQFSNGILSKFVNGAWQYFNEPGTLAAEVEVLRTRVAAARAKIQELTRIYNKLYADAQVLGLI